MGRPSFPHAGRGKGEKMKITLCQCPEWGDLHFHRLAYSKKGETSESCVNALNGATFISTLASGNPHE